MRRCWLIPHDNFPVEWLKGQIGPEDILLALTLSALGRCKQDFPRVFSVEDFVPYDDIMGLAVRAHEVNLEFARQSCRGRKLDGYDWPGICWHMQQWFFRDVLLADRLASALRREKVDCLVWMGEPSPKKELYVNTMKSVAAAMRQDWGAGFEFRPLPWEGALQGMNSFRRIMRGGWEFLYKRFFYREKSPEPCRAVAIWSIFEWERYTDALRDLRGAMGKDFQVWILGAKCPPRLKEWAEREGLHPVTISYPEKVNGGIREFFETNWAHWTTRGRLEFARGTGIAVLGTDALQDHFRFYFSEVWPRLAQWARKTESCLRRALPRWVIGSSNYPPDWTFPLHVAGKLGISSVALPHSFAQYGDGNIQADFLACRNRFERMSFQRPFPDDGRVLYCHNAGNRLSYAGQPSGSRDADGKPVVAVLTANPDYPGCLMPGADRRFFLEDIRKIHSVPPDLAGLHILVKPHPRGDVTPLLGDLVREPSARVTLVDPLASVNDLLDLAWVIVLANHYGGVVVPAVMAGKPLIFLNSARPFWPFTEPLAFAAGEVVGDISAFWDLLRRLRDDPESYRYLADRCREYGRRYMGWEEKSLAQCILDLENSKMPSSSPFATDPGKVPELLRPRGVED